jgi:hypothetical protein
MTRSIARQARHFSCSGETSGLQWVAVSLLLLHPKLRFVGGEGDGLLRLLPLGGRGSPDGVGVHVSKRFGFLVALSLHMCIGVGNGYRFVNAVEPDGNALLGRLRHGIWIELS